MASDQAHWITGQVLQVGGGSRTWRALSIEMRDRFEVTPNNGLQSALLRKAAEPDHWPASLTKAVGDIEMDQKEIDVVVLSLTLLLSACPEMHQRQAGTPYEGQYVTFGFTEGILNGQRLLGHSGAIRGFGSSLDLMPEHNAGYFFSFNAECLETLACEIVSEFRKQFLERFLR